MEGFEAKTVKGPLNKSNKVMSVSVTLDVEGTAKTIESNGGIPYLVSVKNYSYPLVYRSPVKPHYLIYELSEAP